MMWNFSHYLSCIPYINSVSWHNHILMLHHSNDMQQHWASFVFNNMSIPSTNNSEWGHVSFPFSSQCWSLMLISLRLWADSGRKKRYWEDDLDRKGWLMTIYVCYWEKDTIRGIGCFFLRMERVRYHIWLEVLLKFQLGLFVRKCSMPMCA